MEICSVVDCITSVYALELCNKHYNRQRRHGNPLITLKFRGQKVDKENFWSRIFVKEKDDCWEWKLFRDSKGYGKIAYFNKTVRAHRLAWYFTYDKWPTLNILHSCDNPPCCNPNHLREGTQKENVQDMLLRGRNKFTIEGVAKLTIDQVKEIKYNPIKVTLKEIAIKYNISESAASLILNNKRWKQI